MTDSVIIGQWNTGFRHCGSKSTELMQLKDIYFEEFIDRYGVKSDKQLKDC